MSMYLGIRGVEQPLWDFQPLRTEVTVVAIGQLIVHCGHLGSNPGREQGYLGFSSSGKKMSLHPFKEDVYF